MASRPGWPSRRQTPEQKRTAADAAVLSSVGNDSPTSVTAPEPTVRPFPTRLRRAGALCFDLRGRSEFALTSRFCSAKRLHGPSSRPALRGPGRPSRQKRTAANAAVLSSVGNYSPTSVTAPEPTVRPPSRIAKRRPFSMAMGVISSTLISTLSPGMHISVPSGRVMTPVTSVVRK